MRHDIEEKDGSSSFSTATSSPSSVVESELKLIERRSDDEMVTVNNNCVNIDYANINTNNKMQLRKNNNDDDDNNNKHTKLINNNEKEIVNSINPTTNAAAADAALDDQIPRQSNHGLSSSLAFQNCHDDANLAIISNFKQDDDDGDKKNIINDDDDDALKATSSNYLDDVFRRCEMSLQSSSSSTSALSHVAQNTPTPENNRNHRQAVRKNFSLWIGVTSCVWACLVWLMKNYA